MLNLRNFKKMPYSSEKDKCNHSSVFSYRVIVKFHSNLHSNLISGRNSFMSKLCSAFFDTYFLISFIDISALENRGIKTQSRDAILATAAFSDEDKKNGDPQLLVRDKTYRMHDSPRI